MTDRVEPDDIEALVESFQRSDWREMHLRYKDVDLYLSKDADAKVQTRVNRSDALSDARREKASNPLSQRAAETKEPEQKTESDAPDHWFPIKASTLGTFYRAAKPGAAPFVEIGQSVAPDSEICLIEVMKLFTALKAGVSGVVKRICAEDGELIKNGQTLFYVEPDAK